MDEFPGVVIEACREVCRLVRRVGLRLEGLGLGV